MLEQGLLVGERYEIVEVIGSGGMADVYKAKDHKLNRFVAVKVLKPEFREDKTFVSKFKIEAQSAAGLSHPNIVNVFDVGDENGIYFIVMELIEGITLKDYIDKKGKLSIKEAISIAIQVSMGLEAAHNNNIIHRDVKPQNIMISTDGKVKVTDFGIARATSSNTISSNVMGSVHYSSPEQARGGYSDEKSDIYSLGITMYEMVAGKVPFDGETTVAIAIKHLQEEMESPTVHTPELPFSVEQIIYKCTQKSADRRYGSMEELIKDLKQSLINPDGDFVQLVPLNNHAKTVMITKDELEQIKNERNAAKDEEEIDEMEPLYPEDEEEEDDDEDEEEGYISPKLEKIMTIGGIVVVVIIFALLIALIGNALGWFSFGGSSFERNPETEDVAQSEEDENKVTVPDLCDKTYDQAVDLLNELNLGIKRAEDSPKPSDQYDEGMIMEQSYAPGEKVDKYTQIEVVISSGKEDVVVPDLKGQTQTQAEADLLALSLVPSVSTENSSSVPTGNVIRTEPAAGTSVSVNDTVKLIVSSGQDTVPDELVTVPNVLGEIESTAKSTLTNAGLVVSGVESDYSTRYDEDTVMLQSLQSGEQVPRGTKIAIVVSMGPESGQTTDDDNGTETAKWVCDYSLERPENYDGGRIRITITQGGTTKPVIEGEYLAFPYNFSVTSDVSGDGTIIIYEENNTGDFIELGRYTASFVPQD